jgi:hypothetical protein
MDAANSALMAFNSSSISSISTGAVGVEAAAGGVCRYDSQYPKGFVAAAAFVFEAPGVWWIAERTEGS